MVLSKLFTKDLLRERRIKGVEMGTNRNKNSTESRNYKVRMSEGGHEEYKAKLDTRSRHAIESERH